jgi:methylglutaconyl-CoA hydratase
LQSSEHVRVVFLKGAGATFSAGADLAWMKSALDRSEADNREDAFQLARMLKLLWDLPQLTVALVQGAAFAGGAGLVAACDMAVAVADARFCFSETRLGLTPATISPYVVQALGPRDTRRLFATAEVFDAAYAEKVGLITEVVGDAAALEARAAQIAAAMLACAPGAVADAKRMVVDVAGKPIEHKLMEETARRIAAARVSDDGQEGVRAFLEGRKPRWAVPEY